MEIKTSLVKKCWMFLLIAVVVFTACNGTATENKAHGETNGGVLTSNDGVSPPDETPLTYILPSPNTDGAVSVEYALANRRSQRNFKDKALTEAQLSQILWSAYGITSPRPDNPAQRGGLRTAPSAGALYPLEIYAVVGNVEGVAPGVYKYYSEEHKIVLTAEGDVRDALAGAAFGQRMVSDAPLSVFYSAVFSRTTDRYGDRGRHFVYIELGHSAQNIYLQAEALELGTCAIGTITERDAREIINLPPEEEPLYLLPVGYFK